MNLSREVKYLGVIRDDKLTWKTHVRAQVKKGLRDLWLYDAFIGRACGLPPRMTLWLYKCVIIHKITYAAVTMDIALARSKLECLQRVARTMITL